MEVEVATIVQYLHLVNLFVFFEVSCKSFLIRSNSLILALMSETVKFYMMFRILW